MKKTDTTEYEILLQMLSDIVTHEIESPSYEKGGDDLGDVA